MWQAEADTELTLSALPATAVGQILPTMAKIQLEYGNSQIMNEFDASSIEFPARKDFF